MDRREFLAAMAAVPVLGVQSAADSQLSDRHQVQTGPRRRASRVRIPGALVTVHSPHCIDEVTERSTSPLSRR
jgi:hypothetical protein